MNRVDSRDIEDEDVLIYREESRDLDEEGVQIHGKK
jgi:hypothetical protein